MHLAVDIFGKIMKSLISGPTEAEFKVLVQKQLEHYERGFLDPEAMVEELRLIAMQPQLLPISERYKPLRTITFSNFQQFCRRFCEDVEITAYVYGNMYEDHAVEIIENFADDFQCERVENVSGPLQ